MQTNYASLKKIRSDRPLKRGTVSSQAPGGPSSYLELDGIDELAAPVTLVTPGLLIATEGTHALHEAVSQEAGTVLTPQLLHSVLQHKTSGQQPLEDILGNSDEMCKGPGKSEEAVRPSFLSGPKLAQSKCQRYQAEAP